MSVLYLWLPNEPEAPRRAVLSTMESALRVHEEQRASFWDLHGLGMGALVRDAEEQTRVEPVQSAGGYYLWVVGEIFDGGKLADGTGVVACQRREFRASLLERLAAVGLDELDSLDGEYVLVLWDADSRRLTIANDRFGGLPIYWSQSSSGLALAGGVRGVLAAPGVSAEPDPVALREAVTFGGFRLGDRTNVRAVKMLPGGTIVTAREGEIRFRHYWRYGDLRSHPVGSTPALIEEAGALWRRALHLRSGDGERPGQTLSGGLDSRAILAEAAPAARSWTAITYGIEGCDDARFARRAANAAGVDWHFHDIYPPGEDWLGSRTRHIQDTDGLIALGDLMHVDTIDVQRQRLREHFSGYIGDVVCGSTYADIDDVHGLYARLPFYGIGLGMSGERAHQRLLRMLKALDGAPPRFAIFEHKFPQSTNRWTAAWRPWLKVRKPFIDYKLFDFWQGLPLEVRVDGRLYERFLLHDYPHLYARIPNHKTGVPVLTPSWRYHIRRVARFGARKLRRYLGFAPPSRAYHDDRGHLGREGRARLEDMLLAKGSLCGEILGPEPVRRVLQAWLHSGAAPEQVIGAMYVFESYHRHLGNHLRASRSIAHG